MDGPVRKRLSSLDCGISSSRRFALRSRTRRHSFLPWAGWVRRGIAGRFPRLDGAYPARRRARCGTEGAGVEAAYMVLSSTATVRLEARLRDQRACARVGRERQRYSDFNCPHVVARVGTWLQPGPPPLTAAHDVAPGKSADTFTSGSEPPRSSTACTVPDTQLAIADDGQPEHEPACAIGTLSENA